MQVEIGIESWGTFYSISFSIDHPQVDLPDIANIAIDLSVSVTTTGDDNSQQKITFSGNRMGRNILPQHLDAIKKIIQDLALETRMKDEMSASLEKCNADYEHIEQQLHLSRLFDKWGNASLVLDKKIKDIDADKSRLSREQITIEKVKAMNEKIDDASAKVRGMIHEITESIAEIHNIEHDNMIAKDVIENLEKLKTLYEHKIEALESKAISHDTKKIRSQHEQLIYHINELLRSAKIGSPDNYTKALSAKFSATSFISRLFGSEDVGNLMLTNQAFSYLHRVLCVLQENGQLNHENIKTIFNRLNAMDKKQIREQLIQMHDTLNKVTAVDLLVDDNCQHIIAGTFFNKSCPARVEGTMLPFFGQKATQDDKVVTWSHYCTGVEAKIADMLADNIPLLDIFNYACATRKAIAKQTAASELFGVSRAGKSSPIDEYSNKEDSTTNPAVFKTISQAASKLMLSEDETPSGDQLNITKSYSCELATNGKSIQLPDETITLLLTRDQGQLVPRSVSVCFASLDEESFHQALEFYNSSFLERVREHQFKDNDEFLSELGKFTFHLARFYPLMRGSGSVVQWIVRGITKFYTGVELGDISLGGDHQGANIPFDVYAQMTQSPERYASTFQAALLPMINSHQRKKSFINFNSD